MVYSELGLRPTVTPACKRRSFIPEPSPCPIVDPPVLQLAFCEEMPRKKHRRTRTIRAQITHTSCLTAIRNYVINMQKPKRVKHKRHRSVPDNSEKLICSLKNDIRLISKYQQDLGGCNSEKRDSTDPFFVLSAMMCKINKLEAVIIKSTDCEKQLVKRRDMLITAKCIKRSLIEQMQCDQQLLKEKQKKLCYLLKSLEMFEKQIRCMTKTVKYHSSQKLRSPVRSKSILCICPDKQECRPTCPGRDSSSPEQEPCRPVPSSPPPCPQQSKSDSSPCPPACTGPCSEPSPPTPQTDAFHLINPCPPIQYCDPCEDSLGKYDITGVNLTYTKCNIQGDSSGKETEHIQSKVCCTIDENEDCRVTLVRDGNKCPIDPCNNSELKAKINNISKIWLESARQLMDALC